MSRVIPPSVTYPSPNEWTVTYVAVTGIQKGLRTKVTAPSHGITLVTGSNTPGVDFSQIKGMREINGVFGYVSQVIDENTVMVDIDSTNFNDYSSGGYMNKIAGSSPIDPFTNIYP